MANQQFFCYVCGAKVEQKTEAMVYCPDCKQEFYTNPNPAVDIALFNDRGEVLLAERAREPHKGKWDLPGGFIDLGEQAENALTREIKEEINLRPEDYSKLMFVTTYTGKYPWGKVTHDILVLLFVARLQPGMESRLKSQDDVASVAWVRLEDIDESQMSKPGFDEYIRECASALERAN